MSREKGYFINDSLEFASLAEAAGEAGSVGGETHMVK